MPQYTPGSLGYVGENSPEELAQLRGETGPTASVTRPTTLPGGSLRGSMTQPQQQGASSAEQMMAFQTLMRGISQDAYEKRQAKEGKTLGRQFDPSKVSGATFKSIIDFAESGRGGDISKMYAAGVETGTQALKFEEDRLQREEQKRQFDIEQSNKKFDVMEQKLNLGIDSVYIPAGTLADKNNNPGNLRFVGQYGASEGEGGFAKFNTPEEGWQALQNQIRLDQSRGLTLAQFVSKYAPPTENDTETYTQQMAQWLGADPNTPLSSLDYSTVAEMVARKESGSQFVDASKAGEDDIEAMAKQYKEGKITAAQIPAAKRGKVIAASEKLGAVVSEENKRTYLSSVNDVNNLLEGDKYKGISGFLGGVTKTLPGTEARQTAKEYESFLADLKLSARSALKGQGTISDYEMKVLEDAASGGLDRTASEGAFKQKLVEIRGAMQNAAGEKAKVRVTKNGETVEVEVNSQDIYDLIADGATIKYIE